jgi:hypothetical protein
MARMLMNSAQQQWQQQQHWQQPALAERATRAPSPTPLVPSSVGSCFVSGEKPTDDMYIYVCVAFCVRYQALMGLGTSVTQGRMGIGLFCREH